MQQITAQELQNRLDQGEDIQLIDVREQDEHVQFNIGGTLIPFTEILDHVTVISQDKPVVLYCEKGIRSMIAIQRLQQKFPLDNLLNLAGGMSAWKMAMK